MPSLDIVFYDTSIYHVLYLLLPFLPTVYLKSIITNSKIRNSRGNDILFFTHLIVEESFPYILILGLEVSTDIRLGIST